MNRILRVLVVVQDAVRRAEHGVSVFQVDFLKPDLFLQRIQHLQIEHQHRRYLLTGVWSPKTYLPTCISENSIKK